MPNIESARKLLEEAGVFYYNEDELDEFETEDEKEEMRQVLNLNDAFFWACSDCEKVENDELLEVARLFIDYGYPGIYYWVMKKRNWDKVEFLDVNRWVQFVRAEEALCGQEPHRPKRAYIEYEYTISNKE